MPRGGGLAENKIVVHARPYVELLTAPLAAGSGEEGVVSNHASPPPRDPAVDIRPPPVRDNCTSS